jgi:hypothetical protein
VPFIFPLAVIFHEAAKPEKQLVRSSPANRPAIFSFSHEISHFSAPSFALPIQHFGMNLTASPIRLFRANWVSTKSNALQRDCAARHVGRLQSSVNKAFTNFRDAGGIGAQDAYLSTDGAVCFTAVHLNEGK